MTPTATQNYISDVRRIRQSLRTGHILIVDDDLSVSDYLSVLCTTLGEKTVRFRNKENAEFHILINHKDIKLAIFDYMLGNETADELIELCRNFNIPCIIHTGHSDLVEELQDKFPEIIVILKTSPVERLIKEML